MASSDALQPVLFVVPGDPGQNTGGYRYVRRIVEGLQGIGTRARCEGISGNFPIPDCRAAASMDSLLSNQDDGSLVVLDGLAMGALPDVVAAHAERLSIVALVHHPLADETGLPEDTRDWLFRVERKALASVAAIITTSRYTAQRLQAYDVSPHRILVVEPGVDTITSTGERKRMSDGSINLLCVAHLSPRKAQHHLVEALGDLQHLPWHCTFVGSLSRDDYYGQQFRHSVHAHGLEQRVTLAGELDDEGLAKAYGEADLFVFPSLYEGYGMVIDEALSAGLPVITTDGGALENTGKRPGIRQYAAGNVAALMNCLEDWLSDPQLLCCAKREAEMEAKRLRRWNLAAREFQEALLSLLPPPSTFDSNWLNLREPADHQARSRSLMPEVLAWAEREYSTPDVVSGLHAPPLLIADLGAGTGSNARYLAPALTVPQHWVLLDQDEQLLALAVDRMEHLDVPMEIRACHMSADSLASQIPSGTRLITASALIDLMSAPWLEALAKTAADGGAGVYIVLSYDGQFELSPALEGDRWILDTVNAHQHRHKGTGAAMGPDATGYLQAQLQGYGYQVSVAPSPWQLSPEQWELQIALLEGWQQAVGEQAPGEKDKARRWFDRRLVQAREQRLCIRVDHLDLFAWPPSHGAG